MKKRSLSLILAALITLWLLPATVLAEGTANPAVTDANPGVTMSSPEDIPSGAWYYESVQYVVQNGLMKGVSNARFEPDAPMSRAMLAMVLYRLDGSKTPVESVKFSDVAASAWYSDAVAWAAANGIVAGNSDSFFGPDDPVTRQQAAAIFQNYAKKKGRSTDSTNDLSAFSDASEVADWARGAVSWAISSGLIIGTDASTLLPDGPATRAQTAAILMRYREGAALEERTSSYISEFLNGNFKNFYEDASDELRKSISQDVLLKSWNGMLQVSGPVVGSPGSQYINQGGHSSVVSSVEGTLYNIKATISYGSAGKPVGIWMNFTPKEPPKPQSADNWEEIPMKVGVMELPGMLTLPKGIQKPPVVIMVQGSGSTDMNESIGPAPNRPFEDIAHGLAEQGVATLRYNKRTYQYPAGGCDSIEYEVLDDAAAAAQLLSQDSRIDANRIYLLGHSLGGMLAPKIAADNPEIKGFISMAGTLRSLSDILVDQNRASIEAAASLTEQQKKDLLAQAESEINKTRTLDDGGTGFIMGIPTNYWKSLNAIDGVAIVKGLNMPMLIMQGSADFQVYPDTDYKLWQSTLEGRSNITFKLYNGLSHLFMPNQISANGLPDISVYYAANHVAPEVIEDIAKWVEQQ